MTSTDLLTDLGSHSDLGRLVERVARDRMLQVVVASAAVTAWTRATRTSGRRSRPGSPSRA